MRKEQVQVVVYLANGVRLKGVVHSFDNFVILLKESVTQLIYKHAISTIVPEKEIHINMRGQEQ